MKPYSIFTVLLILVFVDSVVAETDTRKYSQGSVVIEYSEFRESETTPSEIGKLKECGDCPGIDGYLPDRITKGMWVTIRGDIFDIPISLTKDLYNLHIGPEYFRDVFKIVETRQGITVELSGGDAIASYRAIFDIDFKNMRAKRSIYRIPNMDTPFSVSEREIRYKGKQP